MANFAALIDVLSVAGSRLSDGTANASGVVWFFQPGTNTPVNVYSDAAASAIVTAPVTLTDGGLVSTADYPDGIFVTQPIRLLIQDVDGNSVSDFVYIPATAGDTGLSNAGWTGTTVDEAFTALYTSLGGTDGRYLIAAGQTPRYYKDVITEQSISVKAFGAVGDGIATDTSAIQNAMNFAKAVGGGVVFFPPGEYKIDQALTLSSATGVSFRGAGSSASVIITTSAAVNVFTLTSCTGFGIDQLGISAVSTSAASAIAFAGCTSVRVDSVRVSAAGGGTFLIPFVFSASSTTITISNCSLTDKASDATSRTIKLTDTDQVFISGGFINSNSGAAIEVAGATGSVLVSGVSFTAGTGSPTGVLFTSGLSGINFAVYGCPGLRAGLGRYATPFDLSALTTDPFFIQLGNNVDGYTTDVTTGATVTPDRGRGRAIRIRGTTTGSAYVVAAPTPTPRATGTTTGQHETLTLDFFNSAGGAITGWTMDAVYHLSAGPSTTNLEHTTYLLQWDPSASVWRQVSRSVTT